MGFVSESIVGEGSKPADAAIIVENNSYSEQSQKGRDELILEYLPVVKSVVQAMIRKLPSFVDEDDLFSAGVLGLIDAADRFDFKRAVRFRTYAELRVRGSVLDYLRSLSWAPRGVRRKMRELDRARSAIESRAGRVPTLSDLALEMGIPVDDLTTVVVESKRAQMCAIADVNEDCLSPDGDPFTHLKRKELLQMVGGAIDGLPERQKLVLWLYYYEQLTMKEVGLVLGVNEARTSQLHSKAISVLRETVKRKLAGEGDAKRGVPGQEPVRKRQDQSRRRSHQREANSLSESREL